MCPKYITMCPFLSTSSPIEMEWASSRKNIGYPWRGGEAKNHSSNLDRLGEQAARGERMKKTSVYGDHFIIRLFIINPLGLTLCISEPTQAHTKLISHIISQDKYDISRWNLRETNLHSTCKLMSRLFLGRDKEQGEEALTEGSLLWIYFVT